MPLHRQYPLLQVARFNRLLRRRWPHGLCVLQGVRAPAACRLLTTLCYTPLYCCGAVAVVLRPAQCTGEVAMRPLHASRAHGRGPRTPKVRGRAISCSLEVMEMSLHGAYGTDDAQGFVVDIDRTRHETYG